VSTVTCSLTLICILTLNMTSKIWLKYDHHNNPWIQIVKLHLKFGKLAAMGSNVPGFWRVTVVQWTSTNRISWIFSPSKSALKLISPISWHFLITILVHSCKPNNLSDFPTWHFSGRHLVFTIWIPNQSNSIWSGIWIANQICSVLE
jgi:hypothetical protein